MEDLISRLTAAIDEVERIAREADAAARWAAYFEGYAIESDAGDWFIEPQVLARHIGRHDPANVLRRCAADRKIVEKYREHKAASKNGDLPLAKAAINEQQLIALEAVIRWLAEGYGV